MMKKKSLAIFLSVLLWTLPSIPSNLIPSVNPISCLTASAADTVSVTCANGETVSIPNTSFSSTIGTETCAEMVEREHLCMWDAENGMLFLELDGAAGSKFYYVYQTNDSGQSWNKVSVNGNPYYSVHGNLFCFALPDQRIIAVYGRNYLGFYVDEFFQNQDKTIDMNSIICDVKTDDKTDSIEAVTYDQASHLLTVTYDMYQSTDLTDVTYTLPKTVEEQNGDINEDGKITVEDAVKIQTIYAKQAMGSEISLTEEQENAADVNWDGSITTQDAMLALTYYAQKSIGKNPTWESVGVTMPYAHVPVRLEQNNNNSINKDRLGGTLEKIDFYDIDQDGESETIARYHKEKAPEFVTDTCFYVIYKGETMSQIVAASNDNETSHDAYNTLVYDRNTNQTHLMELHLYHYKNNVVFELISVDAENRRDTILQIGQADQICQIHGTAGTQQEMEAYINQLEIMHSSHKYKQILNEAMYWTNSDYNTASIT